MFNISSFLEKFSKNIYSLENNKRVIIEIVKKNTSITISLEDLEIKDYVLYVNSSPGTKNKMFIYKAKLLEEISKLNIKIVDIR